MSGTTSAEIETAEDSVQHRSWHWFAAGFAVTFLILLLAVDFFSIPRENLSNVVFGSSTGVRFSWLLLKPPGRLPAHRCGMSFLLMSFGRVLAA